jgi:hypothetical protein
MTLLALVPFGKIGFAISIAWAILQLLAVAVFLGAIGLGVYLVWQLER